ncbi:hypothetical protein NQ318_000312 [Aromia moschata]|uniref:Uncharacterized protein n=1 Tax=Aromia moschata TaxID=1265417 RepID=A0AAV8YUU8_9CUCU|nr:hypothetical protein NQ318_000312 [Aromia moschata]
MFDLLLMLSACDVPPNVLDDQPFREFWNKYVPDMPLPGRTTLRLPTLHSDLVKWIKNTLNKYTALLVKHKQCNDNAITRVMLETLEQFELSIQVK